MASFMDRFMHWMETKFMPIAQKGTADDFLYLHRIA